MENVGYGSSNPPEGGSIAGCCKSFEKKKKNIHHVCALQQGGVRDLLLENTQEISL